MKWLLIFVVFADGSTDYEIFDLVLSKMECETAKAVMTEKLKYGPYKRGIVERAHLECFDTVEVR